MSARPGSQESSDDEALLQIASILEGQTCEGCGQTKDTEGSLCVVCLALDRFLDVATRFPRAQVQHLAADLIERDCHLLVAWGEALMSVPTSEPAPKRARVVSAKASGTSVGK